MSDVEGETSGDADAVKRVARALTQQNSKNWLQGQRI